jgi:hypothetical protein
MHDSIFGVALGWVYTTSMRVSRAVHDRHRTRWTSPEHLHVIAQVMPSPSDLPHGHPYKEDHPERWKQPNDTFTLHLRWRAGL